MSDGFGLNFDVRQMGGDAWGTLLDKMPHMQQVALDRAGKLLQLRLQETVRQQRSEWAPIKMRTMRRKLGRRNPPSQFPTEVWKDTGLLFQHIKYWGEGSGLDYQVQVGVRIEDVGEDRMRAVASLEYGAPSRKIVARPLFEPVSTESQDDLSGTIMYEIERVMADVGSGRNP